MKERKKKETMKERNKVTKHEEGKSRNRNKTSSAGVHQMRLIIVIYHIIVYDIYYDDFLSTKTAIFVVRKKLKTDLWPLDRRTNQRTDATSYRDA